MKRKRFLLLICALLFLFLLYRNQPFQKAEAFVSRYAASIEAALEAGQPLPEDLPARRVSTWTREHTMVEFFLTGRGLVPSSTYYGCYYSPDDVPLPFQNTDLPLTETEPGRWEWTGEGDNRGITQKIQECWYYYEASF